MHAETMSNGGRALFNWRLTRAGEGTEEEKGKKVGGYEEKTKASEVGVNFM